MGLSIQGRAYSLHHSQSFMELSRAFCVGGTQAHVPLTENQAAYVLGSLEAMPWGWVLAELVHSTEGLSGLCWLLMTHLPWCSSHRATTPYTQRAEGLEPPSGMSPCLAGVTIPKDLGAYARLCPCPPGPCWLSLGSSLSLPRGDLRPVMLFQIKVLSPLWPSCDLAAVGRLDLHPARELMNNCIQLWGDFKVSGAEEPKNSARRGKGTLRNSCLEYLRWLGR